jgi:hypothetical protein
MTPDVLLLIVVVIELALVIAGLLNAVIRLERIVAALNTVPLNKTADWPFKDRRSAA